jgi:predicted amidohydrolase YtcJ
MANRRRGLAVKRLSLLACLLAAPAFAQTYDVVLSNGRVMDPESGLDATRNVGINGARIAAISEERLQGRTTIDATGLVVTAGFIDLHSHGQTPENYAFKARDGVTTALELEIGVSAVDVWYAERQGKALVNFGTTSGHPPARMAALQQGDSLLPPRRRPLRSRRPSSARARSTSYAAASTKERSGSGSASSTPPPRRARRSSTFSSSPRNDA